MAALICACPCGVITSSSDAAANSGLLVTMRQALLKGLQAAAPRRMPAKHASRRTCHARAEDAVKEHNHHQQEVFDAKVQYFTAPLPPEITERLARIAAAVPDLAGARVIDVGSGAEHP